MKEPQGTTQDAEIHEVDKRNEAKRSDRPVDAGATTERSPTSDRAGDDVTTAAPASAGAELRRSSDASEAAAGTAAEPLFAKRDAEAFRTNWQSIQAGFVDEPRRAVEQADTLVAEVIQRLAKVFADERSTLEAGWSAAGEIDTEELRVALRRYRSFFDRLLSV